MRGGETQEPVRVIGDTVTAGYNVTLNRSPTATGSVSGEAAATLLAQTWSDPEAAEQWAVAVLGDTLVRTCEGCEPSGIPGSGVLPEHDATRLAVEEALQGLVAGATTPTLANLQTVSAPGIAITRQLLEAVQEMAPAEQQLTVGKLANAIKVFKRCYRLVDYHLYLASVIVRVRGNTHEFGKEIETVVRMIDALLEEERAHFDAQLESLKAELKVKPQDLELTYSHPETVVATMRTPRSKRYLEYILKLETACKIINAAWFAGRIDDAQKLDRGLALQRRLIKLSSRINILAKGLARRVINQDDGENQTYDRLLGGQSGEPDNLEADTEIPVDEQLLDRIASLASQNASAVEPEDPDSSSRAR